MNVNEKRVRKGVECCAEFLCGECPYQEYEHKDYILKCTHVLMKDIDNYLKYIDKSIEKISQNVDLILEVI